MERSERAVQPASAPPQFQAPSAGFPTPDAVSRYIDDARAWLVEYHRQGASGLAMVEAWTTCVDGLLQALFTAAEQEYFAQRSRQGQACALASVGGYGRKELCPHSDIDLLFIYPQKTDAYMESIAERILYVLWDSGLEVGHSIRSIDQCVHLAREDLREATSMLDVRFLAGEEKFVAELQEALYKNVFSKKYLEKFLNAKIDEFQARHSKFGESIYLLEPNIKQGRGALRDLNTIDWVLKARYKTSPEKALRTQGLLSKDDIEALERAKAQLFALRCYLHNRGKRRQDVLDFESQEATARALGLQDSARGQAAEELMRLYYVNAAVIERSVESVLYSVFPERFAPKSSFFQRAVRRNLEHGLVLQQKLVAPGKDGLFAQQPLAMMAVFKAMQDHDARITPAVQEQIRANLGHITDAFRADPEAAKLWLSILKNKKDLYRVLEVSHRAGFLSAYFPEFAHLYCLVQRDLYHIYTVDTHLLFAVQELVNLRDGKHAPSLEAVANVCREVNHFEVLVLAVLFHDIGKGLGKGHSERGAQMMVDIAKRLQLSETQTNLLVDLVRHHLLMAHTTQRRDIRDENQVKEFCKTVKDVETLRCLYVLTVCDMRAVGPEVWNDWKGGLLQELYLRALKNFESGSQAQERDQQDLQKRWAQVFDLLERRPASELWQNLFSVIPARFLQVHVSADLARYLRFVLASELHPEKGVHVLLAAHPMRERGYLELVVYTQDKVGLFAQLTGVLASKRLNILGVETSTWSDGRVLDVFRVVNAQGKIDLDERAVRRLEQELNEIIGGKRELPDLKAKLRESRLPAKARPRIQPARVHLSNTISEFCTVVEVFAADRLGLLYEISKVFTEHHLYIQTALISTDVDQVADVFYVKDRRGNKITAADALEKLEKDLLQVVQ